MGIIGWIILGLLAGLIAKAILPGEDPGGIIITTLIGIAGALIGGFITKAAGVRRPDRRVLRREHVARRDHRLDRAPPHLPCDFRCQEDDENGLTNSARKSRNPAPRAGLRG